MEPKMPPPKKPKANKRPPGFDEPTLETREAAGARLARRDVGRASKITRGERAKEPVRDDGNPFAGMTPAQAAEAMKLAFLRGQSSDLHAKSGHPLLSERVAAEIAARRERQVKPPLKPGKPAPKRKAQ